MDDLEKRLAEDGENFARGVLTAPDIDWEKVTASRNSNLTVLAAAVALLVIVAGAFAIGRSVLPGHSSSTAPRVGAAGRHGYALPSGGQAPSRLVAAAVAFIGNRGAVLSGLCQACSRYSVAVTSDGGRSWHVSAPLPGLKGHRYTTLDGVTFADATNGWVFGDELLATHDGGRTWHPLDVRGPILAVEPVGQSVWLVLSRPESCVSPTNCHGSILVGTANSDHFRPLTLPAPHGADIASVERITPSVAYDLLSDENSKIFYITEDAGSTWRPVRLPCSAANKDASVTGQGSTTVVVDCSAVPTTPPENSQVWRSRDGGRSWALQKRSAQPAGWRAVTNGRGIFFRTHIWPAPFLLEESRDGGMHWDDLFSSQRDSLFTVYASPDGRAWALETTESRGTPPAPVLCSFADGSPTRCFRFAP